MSNEAPSLALAELIERAQTAIGRLKELLAEETAKLAQREAEGLTPILEAKVAALQELEAVERARRELVAAAGFDATDPAGMEEYLQGLADPELELAWTALLTELAELQALNEGNGRIVNRSLRQLERELTILSGQVPGSGTYDPKGKQGPPRSREISRA